MGIALVVVGVSWLLAASIKALWLKAIEVPLAGWLRSLLSTGVRVSAAGLVTVTRVFLADPKLSAADASHLDLAFWLALAGGGLWELAGAVSKSRRERELAKSAFLSSVIFHFEKAENQKRTDIEKAQAKRDGPAQTISHVREVLDPATHTAWLLDSITAFYHSRAKQAESANESLDFRVALFEDQDSVLLPCYSFSLQGLKRNCLISPQKCPERFRLDNTVNPSCAVRCLQTQTPIIVDDGRRRRHRGFFLDETQSARLISLVAYPIIKKKDGQVVYRGALVVDTQVAGFFRKSDKEDILAFLRQIESRLYLQDVMRDLLAVPSSEVDHGQQKPRREKKKESGTGAEGGHAAPQPEPEQSQST